MKFAVLGSGAMGSFFGGYLSLAGHEVTLVDPWREHINAVCREGLVIETTPSEEIVAHPNATVDPMELHPVDAVVVLTKGYATADAARSILHATTLDTWIITVQNGLGNDRVLAEIFGEARVIPGTTTTGAQVVGPGRVKLSAVTVDGSAITHFGRPRKAGVTLDDVRNLAEVFTAAGIRTEALDDADSVVWNKLCMAAGIGPLTAALRCTIGDVWQNEEGRSLMRDMFEEVLMVASAEGVGLDRDHAWHQLEDTLDNVGAHYTSMAVDIRSGRRTEIDSFCFEMVRRAGARGIRVPVCETVGRLVRVLEAMPTEETTAAS